MRNGCILILWVNWRPAMESSGSRTPQASHSVYGYRFRLLGDGFKIKSVTPYCSQKKKLSKSWEVKYMGWPTFATSFTTGSVIYKTPTKLHELLLSSTWYNNSVYKQARYKNPAHLSAKTYIECKYSYPIFHCL